MSHFQVSLKQSNACLILKGHTSGALTVHLFFVDLLQDKPKYLVGSIKGWFSQVKPQFSMPFPQNLHNYSISEIQIGNFRPGCTHTASNDFSASLGL